MRRTTLRTQQQHSVINKSEGEKCVTPRIFKSICGYSAEETGLCQCFSISGTETTWLGLLQQSVSHSASHTLHIPLCTKMNPEYTTGAVLCWSGASSGHQSVSAHSPIHSKEGLSCQSWHLIPFYSIKKVKRFKSYHLDRSLICCVLYLNTFLLFV